MPKPKEVAPSTAKASTNPNLPTLAYTIDETAEVIKVHRSFVYKLIGDGKLDTITLGRRRLVKASSVHALFEAA